MTDDEVEAAAGDRLVAADRGHGIDEPSSRIDRRFTEIDTGFAVYERLRQIGGAELVQVGAVEVVAEVFAAVGLLRRDATGSLQSRQQRHDAVRGPDLAASVVLERQRPPFTVPRQLDGIMLLPLLGRYRLAADCGVMLGDGTDLSGPASILLDLQRSSDNTARPQQRRIELGLGRGFRWRSLGLLRFRPLDPDTGIVDDDPFHRNDRGAGLAPRLLFEL